MCVVIHDSSFMSPVMSSEVTSPNGPHPPLLDSDYEKGLSSDYDKYLESCKKPRVEVGIEEVRKGSQSECQRYYDEMSRVEPEEEKEGHQHTLPISPITTSLSSTTSTSMSSLPITTSTRTSSSTTIDAKRTNKHNNHNDIGFGSMKDGMDNRLLRNGNNTNQSISSLFNSPS